MPQPSNKSANASQRRIIQQQRAALPISQQQARSCQIAENIRHSRHFRNARHIALYLPVRGEADPRYLRKWALPRQQFYLPVLSPFGDKRLWFVRWDQYTRFRPNRFRIPEPCPRHKHRRPARWLDLVIAPLVAFDKYGTRMGMGGGYYDRSFAFKNHECFEKRPFLLGYGYDFQEIKELQRQSWDIALNAMATEIEILHFGTSIY